MRSLEDLTEQQILAMLNPAEPRVRAGNPGAEMLRQMYMPPPQEPISYDALRERLAQLRPMNVTNPPGATMPLGMQEPENTPQVLGIPQSPLTPAQQTIAGQPPAALPPLQEVTVRPQPQPISIPAYQPPAPPQQAAALPAPVPAPQAAAAPAAPSSGVSGNTLLGLAAITDAFAILGGRQPTMLAQMAPIAQQRSQREALERLIEQRRRGALSPEQATILGNAVQQAGAVAGGAAPQAAGGEVPVLRAAPGQDPNEVRGVRTNNPLNLSFANQPNAIGTDGRFAVFQTPEEGVAASVRQLQLYGQRGLNTIDQIISRWAPPSENNTAAYIQAVAQRVGVSPNQEIDLSDPNIMRRLVNAMSVQEVGRVIPEDVLRRGVEIGYQPPQQRAQLTPEQRAIAAPTAAAPGVGAPGTSLRPRTVPMTTELAETLLAMPDSGAALRFLTQLDLQAAQQRGTRILSGAESRSILGEAYDPNKVYQLTQEGGITVVPGTREGQDLTREQQRSEENTLRASFLSQQPVKDYLAMASQVRSIRDAATRENPSRYNDINLVYAYAKMLDPNSVVRETEYGMVIEAGGIQQRLYRWGSVINGQSAFNDQTRREILREAEGRYNSTREAYDVQADAFRELARNAGVRPEMVIPPVPRMAPAQERQQNRPALAEGARQGAVDYLRSEVQAGRMSAQQAIQEARNSGIPNAERLFQ